MRKKLIKQNYLIQSNKKLINIINTNNNFSVIRIGLGAETIITLLKLKNQKINKNLKYILSNNAGIYTSDVNEIDYFCKKYSEAIKNCNFIAEFVEVFKEEQNFFINKYNLNKINSRVLEPFYLFDNYWTLELKNKKVLIINPFIESFKKQLSNDWKMFENKNIFHKDQNFIFYKSYNTSAGNHIHSNWIETFEIMKNDISKLDFDIALLGCGGYGLPLCNFIKNELKKSSIYIGGGLQLLFGVKGKRWEKHPIISKIIKNNGKFISPSGDEILKEKEKIEDGCYW